jgi:hypothetical protein
MRNAPAFAVVATAIAVVLCIPAVYAALRAYDVLFRDEPDPATVIWSWSGHVAMFWRLAIGGYMAATIAPAAYWAARRHPAFAAKALGVLLFVASSLLVVQGVLLP